MKKLLIAYLFIAFSVNAQTNIEGLGKYKIGKTKIDIIDSIKEEHVYITSTISDEKKRGFLILECRGYCLAELIGEANIFGKNCPNQRTFQITDLFISGIRFKNTYMLFYNDSLYQIKTTAIPEVQEAIELKYGKIEPVIKEKEIKCEYLNTGNVVSRIEREGVYTYRNDSLCAYIISSKTYPDCKENYSNTLEIYDPVKVNIVSNFSKRINEDAEIEKLKKKKDQLKDF